MPILNLPTDFPRPLVQSYNGSSVRTIIPAALGARVAELARAEGCTMYTLLLAAWMVLLHRYSGEEEVLLAQP